MMWTDDPIADAERYAAEQDRRLDKLPVCCECGEPIQDDFCYEINDDLICEGCMNTYYRKSVDDYVS
nr:MAG TPA: hypothetical protein [Caudoviricetes sp.]